MRIVAEEWRPLGGVYSQYRYEASSLGQIRNSITKRVKSQTTDRWGYRRVCLKSAPLRQKTVEVHRLVAASFCEGRDDRRVQVNHVDGDKTNNAASNLEWVTDSENKKHGWASGLYKMTPTMRKSRRMKRRRRRHETISRSDVIAMRALYERGVSQEFLSRWFGVHRTWAGKIVNGHAFSDIA